MRSIAVGVAIGLAVASVLTAISGVVAHSPTEQARDGGRHVLVNRDEPRTSELEPRDMG
jgi:hypothetical protein